MNELNEVVLWEAPPTVLTYNKLLLIPTADLNLDNVTLEKDHYHIRA